jgi:hypothetical protein
MDLKKTDAQYKHNNTIKLLLKSQQDDNYYNG